jgi:hypothetical protein
MAKRIWIWLAAVLLMAAMPGRAYGPDESRWSFNYVIPDEDVKTVTVTLSYRWWDPKVDGDLASKKVLLTANTVKLEPGQKSVPIQVLLNGGKSVVMVGKQIFRGRGYLLDASFARATEPKLNYNNLYVLAQKPVDAKNPAAMADVQSAAAWIELGIDPKS